MSKAVAPAKRIELLDYARGVALVAMTVFHFAFDLELFGYQERGFIEQPHWVYFARSIAGSFLFLVGVGLYLAHGKAIRWKSWRQRFLKVSAAALLITVATYFATPDVFIFFGILHSIALASLLGLLFLRLPWWAVIAAAAGIYVLRFYGRTELLNAPVWWWTGLSAETPSSSDYVPVFPWLAPVLLGIAFAKISQQLNWLAAFAKPELQQPVSRLLKFIGRNSLVYYLAHQPVMIGLLYAFKWLSAGT